MTFLELVNALRLETAASGSDLESVEGLVGEPARLKKWIVDAWKDIQRQHTDWRFLWVSASHTMADNDSVLEPTEYTAGEVAEWQVNSFRIAPVGGNRKDSVWLPYYDYEPWRDQQGLDATTKDKPSSFAIHPTTEALHIAPTSDAAYVLYYDYWRAPQVLEDDIDVPIMPARYHDLIVYWALDKYALHDAAPEAAARASREIERLFPQLEIDQLPQVTMRGLVD